MLSLAMHVKLNAMSGTVGGTLIDTGSLRHRHNAFKPSKRPSCAGVSCAAAVLAEGEACQMTRRDVMLLSTAILSYQASRPQVFQQNVPSTVLR